MLDPSLGRRGFRPRCSKREEKSKKGEGKENTQWQIMHSRGRETNEGSNVCVLLFLLLLSLSFYLFSQQWQLLAFPFRFLLPSFSLVTARFFPLSSLHLVSFFSACQPPPPPSRRPHSRGPQQSCQETLLSILFRETPFAYPFLLLRCGYPFLSLQPTTQTPLLQCLCLEKE